MIQFENIHKSFGANNVLRSVDIEFKSSGITALLGPNGSGKTTLIKCFLGLTKPDSGVIRFNGNNVAGQDVYRADISHLPQMASFPENLTPRDLAEMIRDLRPGASRYDALIDLFGIEPEMDKKMVTLSGGNRQKVNLLLALMYDCPLLILDEPTAGLDPVSILHLKSFLLEERARGKCILIITHIMSFVEEIGDHIVFLMDGKVRFDGSLADILEEQQEVKLENAIASILEPGHGRFNSVLK